jgi:hypothetical protein
VIFKNSVVISVNQTKTQDMEKDTYTTDLIFRVYKKKEFKNAVLALFPHEVSTLKGSVNCYEFVGQHGSADYKHCINITRPATAEEYADLKKELEGLGYDINVVKRQNYDKYLADFKRVRGIK